MVRGSIKKHVSQDGTITWRARAQVIDQRTGLRHQPQRTFTTRQQAQAQLRAWQDELRTYDITVPLRPSGRPRVFPMTIYFIAADQPAAIKIGRSRDVMSRLRDLQPASPVRLRLLAVQREGRWPHREADLHARFAALNMWNEWYRAEEPLLTYISTSALPPADYYGALLGQEAGRYLTANATLIHGLG